MQRLMQMMRMTQLVSWLAALLWFEAMSPAMSATLPIANEALLHSARMWEAQARDDLALLALQKLVAARPDSPEALQALGELSLRTGDINNATQVLDQLNTRFAGSQYTATFAFEYRLATRDRLQLASLQRLLELNRFGEAAEQFRRVFPDGAPDGYLAVDYYTLLSRFPDSWQRVHDGLQALVQRHPDDPRFQLAYARHLLRRDARTRDGVQLLDKLATRDDLRTSTVDDALIIGLKDAGPDQSLLPALQRYVARNPQDREAVNLLARTRASAARMQQWWRDTLTLIDAQQAADGDAQEQLHMLRSQDAQLDQALTTLQTLELGTPAAKSTVAISEPWHERGRNELHQHQYSAANLSLRVALALTQQRFEDCIALADELEARGAIADSGALLALAQQALPRSSWLFETRVRWLINHQQGDTALALLDARPTDDKYSPSTQRELRSAALMARADQHQVANPAVAIDDLQAALWLSPDNVWLRYRLATLLAAQGRVDQGIATMHDGATQQPTSPELRYAQALFLANVDQPAAASVALHAVPAGQFTADMQALDVRLQYTLRRGDIDALIDSQQYPLAALKLDELIALQPDERGLRSWRAELDMRMDRFGAARDRFAALVSEQPDDLDARLDYARALTATGETELAHLQIDAVRQRARSDDVPRQLGIARRLWSLDDAAGTSATLLPLLERVPDQPDVWLLAGRSELAQHRYATARDYLLRVEQLASADLATEARQLRLAIDARKEAVLSSALLNRHKPGDAGVSQYDAQTWANAFNWALNYQQRLTLRADAVSLNAGTWDASHASSVLLGTHYLQSAAGSSAAFTREQWQRGLALGALYGTDNWQADVGTTPLGFALVNVVGGIAWHPALPNLSTTLGFERRAVTSSLLSYAGVRDPDTGHRWGGVTATGPYLTVGRYAERYSVTGSLRVAQLTGTHVQSNQVIQARSAADWRWLNQERDRAWLGVSLGYWNYRYNLQNATYGSGGYYSPQSWLSITLPLEWQGTRGNFSYQARIAATYSRTHTDATDYFPIDPTLQQQARDLAAAQHDGEPVFSGGRSSGYSLSAFARVEYELKTSWIVGGSAGFDRSDYYHPVDLSLYARRRFGASRELHSPPTPLNPYNE